MSKSIVASGLVATALVVATALAACGAKKPVASPGNTGGSGAAIAPANGGTGGNGYGGLGYGGKK